MKNKTPILVLTGLAIVAAFGIAGLTREQWMGQPTPAVATPEPAPAEKPATTAEAPATPEKPAATAEAPATPEKPAATAETPAPAEQPAAPADKPAAPAEAPAAAEQPAVPAQQPAGTAETMPPAETPAPAEQTTAAATPEKAAEPAPAAEQPAAQAEQPASAPPAAEPPAAQPEQTASAQPETPPAAETQPAQKAAPEPQVPTFDTVRVEKTGEAVIAGRAAAGAEVIVKLDGQEIGKTIANDDGAFVLVPDKPLPSGSGAITIEATGRGDQKAVPSKESVAVIVPEGQQQQALVAIVSPDAPTKVLQKPEAAAEPEKPAEPAPAATTEQPAEPAPAATTEQPAEQKPAKLVSIDAVDYDAGGNIMFSGQGETGNTARVYVDNQFLGDAPVGDDGRWSYSATANVSQGVHTLRVDGLDAKGNVLNRVEVPIFREDQTKVAAATPPADQQQQPAAEQPAAKSEAPQQPAETAQPPQAAEPAPAQQTEVSKSEPAATTEQPQQPAAQETAVAEQPAKPAEPAAGQTAETTTPAAQPEQQTSQQAQDTVAATAPDATTAAQLKEGRIVIQPGNNLWRISRVLYGDGNKFTMLYQANKDQIRNPNLIYPGQVFRTPEVAPKAGTVDPHRREPLKPEENAGAAE